MHPILIKNADVYAPEHIGTRDIFIAGGKIVAMAEKLDVTLPDLEVIDAAGYIVAPGLVDQHIHITGGGGEGGWHSRCPELVFSELVKAGVTTFLGVSGTDSMTRSVENLLAKVRGLKNEGASGWMWTSNYAYPVTTITKDVRTDMLAIPEVLGVKIALGDHRSSFPTVQEVLALLAEIRVGGMIAGKTGFLHIHTGNIPGSFDIYKEIVAQGFPIKHIRPTHCGRIRHVFDAAVEFAKAGGYIDITTGASCAFDNPAIAVMMALDAGVDPTHITLSTDGHGSVPRFNDKGEMVGLGVGGVSGNLTEVKRLIAEYKMPIEKAITFISSNVGAALGLPGQGVIEVGGCANACLFNDAMELTTVVSRNHVMMRNGEIVQKGTFEY